MSDGTECFRVVNEIHNQLAIIIPAFFNDVTADCNLITNALTLSDLNTIEKLHQSVS